MRAHSDTASDTASDMASNTATDRGRKPGPKPPPERPGNTVMGWHLPGERITPMGWGLIFAVVVLPVFLLGLLLDGVVQLVFGWCLGVWCWF